MDTTDARDHALLLTKVLRPDRGGALRRDDARNLLRRTMELYVRQHRLAVFAWAFLPSRVELILGLPSPVPAQVALADIFGYYTRRFNARYGKKGPLCRTKFLKQLLSGSQYISESIERLHRAPANAELFERAGQEAFSSAMFYERGLPDAIVTPYLPAMRRIRPEALVSPEMSPAATAG